MGAPRKPGTKFAEDLRQVYELDVAELALLDQCSKMLDEIDVIERALVGEPLTVEGLRPGMLVVHPLRVELRQLRASLRAALKQLELPDLPEAEEGFDGVLKSVAGLAAESRSLKARRAAHARWDKGKAV